MKNARFCSHTTESCIFSFGGDRLAVGIGISPYEQQEFKTKKVVADTYQGIRR